MALCSPKEAAGNTYVKSTKAFTVNQSAESFLQPRISLKMNQTPDFVFQLSGSGKASRMDRELWKIHNSPHSWTSREGIEEHLRASRVKKTKKTSWGRWASWGRWGRWGRWGKMRKRWGKWESWGRWSRCWGLGFFWRISGFRFTRDCVKYCDWSPSAIHLHAYTLLWSKKIFEKWIRLQVFGHVRSSESIGTQRNVQSPNRSTACVRDNFQ